MDLKKIPWALAKGDRDGSSLMMRYRQFSDDFPKQKYPVRINIVCDFHQRPNSGMPTSSEYMRLDVVEDELMEIAEKDDSSVLAMVITSSGKREFIFQSSDADGFYQRVNEIYSSAANHELAVCHDDADQWGLYDSYIPKN